MMLTLLLVKFVHLVTMALFVGTVYFRTFVIPALRDEAADELYDFVDRITGKRARRIMQINVALLLSSGAALLYLRGGFPHTILLLKVLLGLLLGIGFYFVPLLLQKIRKRPAAIRIFHLIFFSGQLLVILLAKLSYI